MDNGIIVQFIGFFLIFWWLMLIIYKINLPVKLYNRYRTKFIDQLTNCEFCMESHTATLLAIILAVIDQNHLVIFFGPMAAALSNLLKR